MQGGRDQPARRADPEQQDTKTRDRHSRPFQHPHPRRLFTGESVRRKPQRVADRADSAHRAPSRDHARRICAASRWATPRCVKLNYAPRKAERPRHAGRAAAPSTAPAPAPPAPATPPRTARRAAARQPRAPRSAGRRTASTPPRRAAGTGAAAGAAAAPRRASRRPQPAGVDVRTRLRWKPPLGGSRHRSLILEGARTCSPRPCRSSSTPRC